MYGLPTSTLAPPPAANAHDQNQSLEGRGAVSWNQASAFSSKDGSDAVEGGKSAPGSAGWHSNSTTSLIEPSYYFPVNMRLARNSRVWWSRWLVASLLFLQLASAAYACSMGSVEADSHAMPGMPCGQSVAEDSVPALDPEQPGLCLEHCRSGSQTIDQSAAASLAVPALVPLFFVAPVDGRLAQTSAWQAQQRSRERAPPPAHSILHCCYRI
jgi:hypothetical protein